MQWEGDAIELRGLGVDGVKATVTKIRGFFLCGGQGVLDQLMHPMGAAVWSI
jgi:hypothetical protein